VRPQTGCFAYQLCNKIKINLMLYKHWLLAAVVVGVLTMVVVAVREAY
jgi:hypothetical protein